MSEDDDCVGYGRPPKKSQFKPGRSGNPNGRPRGSRDKRTLREVLSSLLDQKIDVRIDGKNCRVSQLTAFAISLAKRGIENPGRGTALRKLMKATGFAAPPPAATDVKHGVLAVAPSMSVEEWETYWDNVQMPTDPLSGLPGMDAERMHRARAEKRQLQQVGYDDSNDPD